MAIEFAPETIVTTDVKIALSNYAQKNEIAIDRLSFDIISYACYYKTSSTVQWVRMDEEKKRQINQIKYLTNERLELLEQYKIKIYVKFALKECQPIIDLVTDDLHTHVDALILGSSVINATKNCLIEFRKEIERKVVFSGYLLSMFTLPLEKILHNFMTRQAKAESPSNTTITVAKAVVPNTSINGTIVQHYLHKNTKKTGALEDGVDEGELILEYRLPFIALGGRDCKGKYLPSLGPKIKSNILLTFDAATIRREVTKDALLFYAQKKGFAQFDDDHLRITNQLQLDGISMKETGHITPGDERDISIKVREDDDTKDAISQGVNIHVNSIDIKGSVAGNTTIIADTISIGQQTHKNSLIEVKEDAHVFLHRGNIKAKHAHIKTFEHGIIKADTINVNELLGGEIYAREVTIGTLYSNAKIYASEKIIIKNIVGEQNSFIIAPNKIEAHIKRLSIFIQHIKDKIEEYNKQKNLLDDAILRFESNFTRIESFKAKAVEALKKGENIPTSIAVKIRQFENDSKLINGTEQNTKMLQHHIEELKEELTQIKNVYRTAEIIYERAWEDHQEIIFEHTDSQRIDRLIPEGVMKRITYEMLDEESLQIIRKEA